MTGRIPAVTRHAMTPPDDAPLACSLSKPDRMSRTDTWQRVTDAALRSRVATPTGVRLEFEPSPATAHVLLDLVAAERGCCGWASWTLTDRADSTMVEATADESGADVLHAMFGLVD